MRKAAYMGNRYFHTTRPDGVWVGSGSFCVHADIACTIKGLRDLLHLQDGFYAEGSRFGDAPNLDPLLTYRSTKPITKTQWVVKMDSKDNEEPALRLFAMDGGRIIAYNEDFLELLSYGVWETSPDDEYGPAVHLSDGKINALCMPYKHDIKIIDGRITLPT